MTNSLYGYRNICIAALLVVEVALHIGKAEAVLPALALDVFAPGTDGATATATTTMLLSHAQFGTMVAQKSKLSNRNPLSITYPPLESDPLLCQTLTSDQLASLQLPNDTLLMVPRGTCTFETKALHAQALGAAAVIVYGSLASRYSLNTTNANATGHPDDYTYTVADILYPLPKYDYDCDKGSAWIDASAVVMDDPLPYNPAINDAVLSDYANGGLNLNTNACRDGSSDTLLQCPSQSCLLTGLTQHTETGEQQLQACCAWDLHIHLFPDVYHPMNATAIQIPAAYMSAAQASELFQLMAQTGLLPTGSSSSKNNNELTVLLYARWRPPYNISAILIWLLGTAIAAAAAYLSATDYRTAMHKEHRRQERRRIGSSSSQPQNATSSTTTTARQTPPPSHTERPAEDVLELTAWHALGFVVMASTSLLVLFYFKIYGVVKVFYAIGCSTAVSQVLLAPLYTVIVHKWAGKRHVILWRTDTEDFGDITLRDVVSHILGFGLGISWLVLAFTNRNAEELLFFWVMQDVFGACMCISFLKVIQLNSIRVASILLIVAFFYDIFFVFISPLVFGKSVMIIVATSGGPPKADELYCEKYPNDKDCQGGNPLPMLLAIPKLFDFVGGSSLLGLGDIVLPGLLLSFASRLDTAKALLGIMGGGRGSANQSYNCPEQDCCNGAPCGLATLCRGGYFAPLVVAYAIGLAMANTAVYVMKMGQPALLYLVPCCLGTLVYIGWRRQELRQLWDGPRVLRTADDIVLGPRYASESAPSPLSQHSPLPIEEMNDHDGLMISPPSAVDDDFDNDDKDSRHNNLT